MEMNWTGKTFIDFVHKTLTRVTELITREPLIDFEENIKPLVEAINIRYRTRMSCEGHSNRGCPYPWVDLANFQDLSYFEETLKKYNSTNKLTWILHESHFDPDENETVRRLMPECKVYGELSEILKDEMDQGRLKELKFMAIECITLEAFQESANNLARYLDENWKK